MPTPSQFPALPSSELQAKPTRNVRAFRERLRRQDRLRLAKTQFDENVETLRAEFERAVHVHSDDTRLRAVCTRSTSHVPITEAGAGM